MSEVTKPGIKTATFWLSTLATATAALVASGAGLGAFGSAIAMTATGLTAAGYAAFRTFAKSEDPAKPAYKTTEFWLSIAAAAVSIAYAAGVISAGGAADKVIGFVAALLAMAGHPVAKRLA